MHDMRLVHLLDTHYPSELHDLIKVVEAHAIGLRIRGSAAFLPSLCRWACICQAILASVRIDGVQFLACRRMCLPNPQPLILLTHILPGSE